MRQSFQDQNGEQQGFSTKRKIAAAVAKMLKKVIPKNKVLKDKPRYKDSPPGGEELVDGRSMVQSLTPEGESAKRPIKVALGGLRLNPKGGR